MRIQIALPWFPPTRIPNLQSVSFYDIGKCQMTPYPSPSRNTFWYFLYLEKFFYLPSEKNFEISTNAPLVSPYEDSESAIRIDVRCREVPNDPIPLPQSIAYLLALEVREKYVQIKEWNLAVESPIIRTGSTS